MAFTFLQGKIAVERAHQRTFSAARATDKVNELAFVYCKIKVVQHQVLALEDPNVVQSYDRALAHFRYGDT